MPKVLLITYYWPPSGGAGVQRWLKLTKYLIKHGVEVHIITVQPEKASYPKLDSSLLDDVHSQVTVHFTNSFEIIQYYSKIVGQDKVPTAGFSNVNNKNFLQKLVNSLRSNLFIPDPRKGWNKYAYQKACEVIEEHSIDTVITTSPPHSTQLIGIKLKQNKEVKWIADLRDPWTDIYYYPLLGHSRWSKKIDVRYEQKVIEQCDKILTVSLGLKEIFLSKTSKINEEKIMILPNGFDPQDFEIKHSVKKDEENFVISYTGTMSNDYHPTLFFQTLKHSKFSKPVKLQFVGSISEEIKKQAIDTGLRVEFIPTVPHSEIINYQLAADLLLLIIPDVPKAKGILTGKLFEYLATENPILAIVPEISDAAQIIRDCSAGFSFTRQDGDNLKEFLIKAINKDDLKIQPNTNRIAEFSRNNQALKIKSLL